MRRFSGVIAILAVALVMVPLPASAAPATLVVDGSDGLGSPTDCDALTVAYATIGLAIAAANSGDTVKVCPGTYPESPDITKSLTLESTGGRDVTTIELEASGAGLTYLGSLEIEGPNVDVTVTGFTIKGRDADCSTLPNPTLANSNVLLSPSVNSAVVENNRFEVGAPGSCTNGDDGTGVITHYDQTTVIVNSLTVENNIFQPLNTQGSRAFYINPGVDAFTFSGNAVNGNFGPFSSITQAKNGLIENNVIDGGGSPGANGLGTWGYPDAAIWGHTTFRANSFQGLFSGITINESNDILIEGNELSNNGRAIRVRDFDANPVTPEFDTLPNFDPTTIHIHLNNIVGNTPDGVNNSATTTGTVDGTCNWWGDVSGPTNAENPGGTGDTVVGDVAFKSWLIAEAPDGACTGTGKLKPTITTTLSASVGITGDKVHDSAKLNDPTTDVGGSVDYRYYGSLDACTADTLGTGGTFVGHVTLTATGTVPDSPDATFNTAGTFYWAAFYNGDSKNEPAKSDCGSEPLVIATQVAKITPTGTTCQQYQSGTAATLGQVLYTITKGKIGAVSPGVFFYYTRVSGSAGDTVAITQSHTGSEPVLLTIPIQMKQVLLYSDPGCATLKWSKLTVSGGTAIGTLPSAGNFIVSVKYDSGSLKGKPKPVPETSTYTFDTNGVAAYIARVDLAKK
jgi:hypothetical protein